jgi:quinol monooxygenase YgiN
MAVNIVVQGRSKDDDPAGFMAYISTLVPQTRAFDGCEDISFHRKIDDPSAFMLLETWTSQAHYDTYVAWRKQRGELQQLFEYLSGRARAEAYLRADI